MRCSFDKVLLDARQLANRIRATDETADVLIKQASDAHNKIIAKKQCQEEVLSFEELTHVVKGRPRSRLMVCIASENKQLELLGQENKVLRMSLNEYETTFEMIMDKFRKHKHILKKLDQLECGDFKELNFLASDSRNPDITSECKVITLYANLVSLKREIERALIVDNKVTDDLSEIETKLTLENFELRRLVDISLLFSNDLQPQTDMQSVVVNGLLKEMTTLYSPGDKIASKVVNHHFKDQSNLVPELCASFSDDDDDHSSVSSDASIKTLT